MRSRRHQTESICERSGVFFLRYYIREEKVEEDETGKLHDQTRPQAYPVGMNATNSRLGRWQ